MKKQPVKMALHRETLRQLDPKSLTEVAAGITYTDTCATPRPKTYACE